MKKNFLTAVALSVAAFFVATEIAVAADVSFSGQLRTRYEYNEQGTNATNTTRKFAPEKDGDDSISTRMRLNTKVQINDSTSAFIQMQSIRTWGNDLDNTAAGGFAGSGNSSFSANDGDASVGLHEAYFTLKNFAGLPADLKMGRQQVVLDGHRLFGHTGWTTGANTHDAIRLTHKGGNHTLSAFYILAGEEGRTGSTEDNMDVDVYVAHANFQGVLGGGLSLIFAANIDECGLTAANACANTDGALTGSADNNIYTLGFRQAGQLFGIDYRGEYYHQWGDAIADATITSSLGYQTSGGPGVAAVDRDAYMFGLRIGKKFSNVAMKPSLTIWYDHLSGTDDSDINGGDWGTFNTLFDTGHKFYGHMDLFLSNVNHGTAGLGLTDFAVKASIQPMAGWTVKFAWHKFQTDVDPSSNLRARGGLVGVGVDEDLGQETDIAIIHKYNANTKISAGYSVFAAEELFNLQSATVGNSADWAYIMFDVKF